MKLKQLEAALQEVSGFESPKLVLEQYETPAHIAAHLLYTADTCYADISGCTVADIGCGCGMLTVGAALMGAAHVTGIDLDEDALEACQANLEEFELPEVELLQEDIKGLGERQPRLEGLFHTVVLNPPFGTKNNQGADLEFLKAASFLSESVVYSLHKSSTRDHVLEKASKQLGLKGEVLAQLRYNLPKTYKFHKKASVDIEVDFIRFEKTS